MDIGRKTMKQIFMNLFENTRSNSIMKNLFFICCKHYVSKLFSSLVQSNLKTRRTKIETEVNAYKEIRWNLLVRSCKMRQIHSP
jgi:hypothetical protein